MRIAFVIPTLDQSGAERQLTLLAEGLSQRGCDVHVIALVRSGHFEEQLTAAGVTVHTVGKRFRFDPWAAVSVRRLLKAIRPQIVQSFLFSANTLVRLPGVVPADTRIVVSERCVDSWKRSWQLWLDRTLMHRTAAMTANSASVAEFYETLGMDADRIHVIRNGMPAAPAERDVEWLRHRFQLPGHLRLVGYVGRLAEQKRVNDLIWAFQLLHQIVDHVHLVVIGDGPQRAELEQFARNMGCHDRMTFAGHCDDAYRLMQGLDVFCLPSSFEGMSNSLMEAMSLGLPVAVSDIPANQELVQQERTGLLFSVGKGPELTAAIRRLLEEPELAARLGTAAAQFVREHCSVESLIEQHMQLYDQLLSHHAAPVTGPQED